jgi:hypothetical protein
VNAATLSAPAQANGPIGSPLVLEGLEPDNLLAFLALLGLLRALETAKPEWQPRVAWCGMPMTAELHLTARADAQDMVAAADVGIRELGQAYDFDRADIIYKPEDFRRFAAKSANDRERAMLVAALASDGAARRDGETVEPTSLCAMFGQGHQHFLSRLAGMATRDHPANELDLSRALFEPWRYEDETDGFRWDPMEDRRYAHQSGDPSESKNKIGTVTGANRLAVIGFGVLASAPTGSGLATLGIAGTRRERNVCWPIVAVQTSLAGYLALVAHPWLGDDVKAPALAAYGVRGIARARRYKVGKFFNYERALIQVL